MCSDSTDVIGRQSLTAEEYKVDRRLIKEGEWMVGLWSQEPEKAKKAVEEVVGKLQYRKVINEKAKIKEPLVDVFDEKDLVHAGLPGVKEKDIKLDLESVLKISVSAEGEGYSKEILLPTPAEITDRKNILEVRLKKIVEK